MSEPVNKTVIKEIPISKIKDNPLNDVLFRPPTEKEMNALYFSVKRVGIANISTVYRCGMTDEYVLVSGHNRKKLLLNHPDLEIDTLRCEVIERPLSEVNEMLLMVAHNLGRGVKDTWAIKIYKHIRQILCRLKENAENESESHGDDILEHIDTESVATSYMPEVADLFRSVDIYQGKRMADVIRDILGVSHRQQRHLAWLASKDLREKLYERIQKVAKVKKDAIKLWEESFTELEAQVANDEISLQTAGVHIEAFIEEVKAIESKGKPKKEKPAKQPKPVKASKAKPEAVGIEAEDEGEECAPVSLVYQTITHADLVEEYGISLDSDTQAAIVDDGMLAVLSQHGVVYVVAVSELSGYFDTREGM
ncbi:MAG: hypothetical protein JNL32_07670 [Candidatus Kapabacteria bacterium]|nr:hypothetical protein [Candidatus Kapabacteria bacterium]